MEELDPAAIANLRLAAEDAFSEMLDELIDVFVESTEDCFAEMEKALAGEDREVLNRASHSVKGAAQTFGSTRFGPVAHQLEVASKTEDWETLTQLTASLKALFPQFLAALRQLQQEAG